MKKSFLVQSLAVVGAASLLGTLGLAAVSAFAATSSTATTTSQPPAPRPGHFGHGMAWNHGPGQLTDLTKMLNISASTLQADLKAHDTLAQIAQKQGVSTATLTSGLEANFKTKLDALVTSGKLTATEEQTMITRFDSNVTNRINGTGRSGLPMGQGMGHDAGMGFKGQMTDIEKMLNISASTLKADLKAHDTLAQIAQKQGVSTATLTSGLEANFKTKLDALVTSGKLTATEEQTMITRFDSNVANRINGTGFMGRGFHGGPWGQSRHSGTTQTQS